MTAFLIDEMFPIATAVLLRDTYGHDAVHVAEVGLRATEDKHVAAVARGEGRAVVTRMSQTSPPNATSCSCLC